MKHIYDSFLILKLSKFISLYCSIIFIKNIFKLKSEKIKLILGYITFCALQVFQKIIFLKKNLRIKSPNFGWNNYFYNFNMQRAVFLVCLTKTRHFYYVCAQVCWEVSLLLSSGNGRSRSIEKIQLGEKQNIAYRN